MVDDSTPLLINHNASPFRFGQTEFSLPSFRLVREGGQCLLEGLKENKTVQYIDLR